MSLFESVSIVPTMGVKPARKPESFYWDITLELTSMGLIPISIDSSLPWVPYLGPPSDFVLEEIWKDGHLLCIKTIVENVQGDYVGTFVHEIVILWVDEFGPDARTTDTSSFSDGTNYFQGMKAHGKAWVEFTTDTGPNEGGPILIQHEKGTILWMGQ